MSAPEDERSIKAQTASIRKLREDIEAGAVEPHPTCGVCFQLITEARRYRNGWVYHSTCSRCRLPVCEKCIGDSDWSTDQGGYTHCKKCCAPTEELRDAEPIEYSGLSRWERMEAYDEREEKRERLERERGDRS